MSQFVLARYGTGTGGKFLCCLLQLSEDLNTWDTELEQAKTNQDQDAIFAYFKKRFGKFETWLDNEPQVPYVCDPVANLHKFDYDTLDWNQAWPLLIQDPKFNAHYQNNKKILLITSHSRIPCWLWNRVSCVNMHINNLVATKWVHRAQARKLFKEESPGVFIPAPASGKDLFLSRLEPDLPPLGTPEHDAAMSRRRFVGSKFSFLKKYVCKSRWNLIYKNYKKITAHPSNSQAQQIKFDISNIQTVEHYYQGYCDVCSELAICLPDPKLVKKLIDYYIKLH